jgi:S1-C subfamily serine protease
MSFAPFAAIAKIVTCAALLAPQPSTAATLAETIAKLKPSVVAIGTHQELRRPPDRFLGTGFAIGDGTLIATANHVIPSRLDTANNEYLCVFFGTGKDTVIVPVRPLWTDGFHDSAVLKLARGGLPPVRLEPDDTVGEGTAIAFTGYPIGAVLGLYPVTHRGIVSARTPIAIPQVARRDLDSRMIRQLRHPFDVYQLDATAYPGNSGSPLYEQATGRVIGIVSDVFVKESKERLLSEPSGITFAIPIRYVRALLEAGTGIR